MTDKELLKRAAEYQSFKPGSKKKDWNEYNGLDILSIGFIQDDKIYALAHNLNIADLEQGNPIAVEYYFDQATYDKFVDPITGEFDAKALGEALQVKPYQSKEMAETDGHAEYRNSIVCFERKGELNIPVGICEANTQFGGGGAHQAFIPAEETVKLQQMGILQYNREASNICTGQNYRIEEVDYEKIQFASNERCKNCNENNLKHPQEIACQSGFELNEPILGNPFNATYTREIDKETTASEVTTPKISTERYRLEIKNDNGYPPLSSEKAQTAKELAAEILNEQKNTNEATIYFVGNNTILVTDSSNIPYGNANLKTGRVKVTDYEFKAELNNEIKSKMNRSGKVTIDERNFINEVNRQIAFDKLSKQLAEEQKSQPKVDRSKMSLEEKRKSRAEAKGKFQDAKKNVYVLKMELEHELTMAKLGGMDSQSMEKTISTMGKIADATNKMEMLREEFQNIKVSIKEISKEKLQYSHDKISSMLNKTTESIDAKIATGKATLINMRDEARKVNQKLEHWSDADKVNFNEKVNSINKNRIKLNYTLDKVIIENLDKTQTALHQDYKNTSNLKETEKDQRNVLQGKEKQENTLHKLESLSMNLKNDMKELQQEFSATVTNLNRGMDGKNKGENLEQKEKQPLEKTLDKNSKNIPNEKSVKSGMTSLDERLQVARKATENKKIQSPIAKNKDMDVKFKGDAR